MQVMAIRISKFIAFDVGKGKSYYEQNNGFQYKIIKSMFSQLIKRFFINGLL